MRFDALKEILLKGGIAPRHVRRYLRELDDHLADLTAAQCEAGHDGEDAAIRARALLGDDGELAAAMLAQPESKSWPARAPWLVFGLLPPVAIVALFAATVLPLVVIKKLHETANAGAMFAPVWFQGLIHGAALFANLGLGPGLAALLVWTALRQRLDWKWPLLAVTLIALLGAHMAAYFPPAGQRGGSLSVSLGLAGVHVSHMLGANQFRVIPPGSWRGVLVQFFLTLAPALWLLRDHVFARPGESR